MAVSNIPPSNDRLEQVLLGELLRDNRAIGKCLCTSPDHFIDPVPRLLFAETKARVEAGTPADANTLAVDLEHSAALAGDVMELVSLAPDEVLEFALIHESHAESNDQIGKAQLAERRGQRAEQLRALLGEAQA